MPELLAIIKREKYEYQPIATKVDHLEKGTKVVEVEPEGGTNEP